VKKPAARLFNRRAAIINRRSRIFGTVIPATGPDLLALYTGDRAIGGRGFAGILFSCGHGIGYYNGFVAFYLEYFRAIAGAQTAAYAGGFIYSSFHLRTSV